MPDATPPQASSTEGSPETGAESVRRRGVPPQLLARASGDEGREMVGALLAWYARERRILPWREQPGPYRTWVSEVMLQQTRVETVLPRFERFLARFPTVQDLAAADLDELLEEWAGLGYYSRARNLHAAAREVAALDRFPSDVAGLRRLPGIGAYVAGAVASIALGLDEVAVDGNAERVISRVFAFEGTRSSLAKLARAMLPTGQAGAFNQALMDLGSALCTPRSARCSGCPLAGACQAHALGQVDRYPRRRSRRSVPRRPAVGIVVRRRGRVLLGRRPAAGLFGGLYELPGSIGEPGARTADLVADALARHLGQQPIELGCNDAAPGCNDAGLRSIGSVRHSLTHMHLCLELLELPDDGSVPDLRSSFYTAWSWVDPGRPEAVALSTLARKALTVVAATPS